MNGINRAFVDDVINTYFEMGCSALEKKEFAIALKMFKAVFDEPSSKAQKEKIMLSLLVRTAEAHEGLKQLYKAKLLYIRALAQHRKVFEKPTMQSTEILLTLAHLTAQQGLYRQALEFAQEAFHSYNNCMIQSPIDFVRNLRRIERIMQLKGRHTEQQKLVEMLERVRSEALQTIPNVAAILPSAVSLSV
jgi:tetratricopeptide (TPR) repeat protein